jgi:hypothetical protein
VVHQKTSSRSTVQSGHGAANRRKVFNQKFFPAIKIRADYGNFTVHNFEIDVTCSTFNAEGMTAGAEFFVAGAQTNAAVLIAAASGKQSAQFAANALHSSHIHS